MTYKELVQEFGISNAYLSELAELGIIEKRSAMMLGSYDGEELKRIRKCCLFGMLGIGPKDYAKMLYGEADFKMTLKHQVDEILNDEDNRSQAAIVLQNMKRECESEEELDPEPYLQHIKELKYQGGIFYSINSNKPVSEDTRTAVQNKPRSFRERLSSLIFYESKPEEKEDTSKNTENAADYYKSAETPDFSESSNASHQDYYKQSNSAENSANENNSSEERHASDPGYVGNSRTAPETRAGENPRTASETNASENPDPSSEMGGTEKQGMSSGAGTAENWNPYNRGGYGASNLGSGNWQGWSPGYGTYAKPIGVRERVNNGEKTCPHPFRRFAARIVDTTLVSLICGAILRLGFRINVNISVTVVTYCEIIFWLFEMMIEPLLLATIGTTPGKFIMGLKVRDSKTKGTLDIKRAYIRSLKLAWQGFGFMIPIYSVYKRAVSFLRCKMDDTMPWDEGIDVELTDESPARIVLIIAAIILLNLGDEVVSKQALIPGNRGEITKTQFYENVAEVINYTGYSGDIPNFIIEEKNGYVSSVTLKYTSEQSTENRYDEMYIGFMAFAGASEGSNGVKLLLSPGFTIMKVYYTNFQSSYGDIEMINTSDSEVKNQSSYSSLLSALYGTEVTSIPAFNQTFTLTKQ